MTRTRKYMYIIGSIMVAMIILSIFLPKSVTSTVERKMTTSALVNSNLLKDPSTYGIWHPKVSTDTSYHNRCLALVLGGGTACPYSSSQYKDGEIRILKTLNDTTYVMDASNNNISYKYHIKPSDDGKSMINVKATKSTGFIFNLWNMIYRWKLSKLTHRQLDGLEKEGNKRINESTYRSYVIKEVGMDAKSYLTLQSSVDAIYKNQFYAQNISALFQKSQTAVVNTKGNPCVLIYNDPFAKKLNIAAAIESVFETNIEGTETKLIPKSNAAKLVFSGPKDKTHVAHKALTEYLADRNLKLTYPIIEEYVTDPSREPDPYKWITNIYYYFASPQ